MRNKIKLLNEPFQARWPIKYLFSYVIRRLILFHFLFICLLFIFTKVLFFEDFKTSSSLLTGTMISSLILLILSTLSEYYCCGKKSFLFSFTICFFIILIILITTRRTKEINYFITFLPIIWLITSKLIHFISGLIILPAQVTFDGFGGYLMNFQMYTPQMVEKAKLKLNDELNGESIELITPDNDKINTMLFANFKTITQLNNPSTGPIQVPTVLFFNGNNETFEFKYDEIKLFMSKGFNVFVFNYRAINPTINLSKNKYYRKIIATRDSIVLDGETCVQYLLNRINISESCLYLYGTSLGGAIATEIATLHSKCVLIVDRSFSSLAYEAEITAPQLIGIKNKKIKYFIGKLSGFLICYSGWEFNSSDNWKKVKGKKCLIYHPKDRIVPEIASLFMSLKNEKDLFVIKMGDCDDNEVETEVEFNNENENENEYDDDDDDDQDSAHCRMLDEDEENKLFEFIEKVSKN